jgi:DNA-binding response OmpR family regulator
MRILVVEDNEGIAAALRSNLELEGFEVAIAEDGAAAVSGVGMWKPDLVVLDLMLPKVSGFEVLRLMRAEGHEIPVLVLSARSEEADKLEGFRLGADDYVTKPFGLMEVLARVDALLRRRAREFTTITASGTSTFTFGEITVETATRRVTRRGVVVELRPREFDLLVALLRHEGRVVSRKRLLLEVWAYDSSVVSRTVDTHMLELRRRLEQNPANPRHLQTVRGAGYRLQR